jgi:glycosyltransferase involved in cell wall biosynthesis
VTHPRVLIVALSRINSTDTANNGLLLRNLFSAWPRERLAQIYSGGSNGDGGFCGHEYQVAARDRRFGEQFFKLKKEQVPASRTSFSDEQSIESRKSNTITRIKAKVGSFIQDSGFYEIIFKIKPSEQLLDWVREFDPEIVLAQGYNLSFIWLPLMLKRQFKIPMAFYNSDDWPSYLYASGNGLFATTAPFMRRIVASSTKELIADTDMPFAFNDMMGEEYERRYGKSFKTLMHCDDPERFRIAEPIRLQPPGVNSIVATGAFDDSRWPLLLDLEESCQRLSSQGIPTRATVLTMRVSEEGYRRIKSCRFVTLQDDPGHKLLPSYLKGADLLYLAETFDPEIAHGYRYSISTKAHLFMFSQRPIIVYGHPGNGLVKYADREGWACVVSKRDTELLTNKLILLLTDEDLRNKLIQKGNNVAQRNNSCSIIQDSFVNHLTSISAAGRNI